MHDEQYRISLDIPPMSVMYFVPKNIRLPEDDKPEAENKAEKTKAKVDKTADKTVVKNNKSQKENDK